MSPFFTLITGESWSSALSRISRLNSTVSGADPEQAAINSSPTAASPMTRILTSSHQQLLCCSAMSVSTTSEPPFCCAFFLRRSQRLHTSSMSQEKGKSQNNY